jgi:hypothetical protein
MSGMSKLVALSLPLTLLASFAGLAAEPGAITEYTAAYEVHNDGRHVANAEFSVVANDAGHFVFTSSARARGILRLVRPDPAVEHSEFRLVDERIAPLRFRYDDGSRKGEDNFAVEFDSTDGEVRVTGPSGNQTLPLQRGLLDRGSLQVALMRDLLACRLPGPYRYVDDDGIGEYRYERIEDRATETGIGTLDTIRFSQRREGSSRETILWLAPELGFLPVRIEQIRDGEIDTSFALESLAGIEREDSSCSGLR